MIFGLSRNLYSSPCYHKKSDNPLLVKWLALETLNYRIQSVHSDVGSYGVILWKLFSLARTPYPGIEPDKQFTKKLESGYRMAKPQFAPEKLYKVILVYK